MFFPEAPLLFDEADERLYIPRSEPQFWLHSATQGIGGGWLLLGAPGTGKTTLLRWLQRDLASKQAAVAWVDAGTASSAGALVEAIAREVPPRRGAERALGDTHAIQEELQSLRERPRTCVLIDNLADPQAAFDLFGRMRDLVWASGHAYVVSGRPESVSVLRRPPADAFFSHAWQLTAPDAALLHELCEKVQATDRDVERLLRARPPSLRAAIRYLNRPELVQDAERWRERLVRVRPAAASVGEQIMELERPVTPDDSELQARTGLGSIALRRYLRLLEREGLLRVVPEPTGRPGRPRLAYRADVTA